GLVASASREADESRVGARPLLEPDGRKDSDPPCDQKPHAQSGGCSPKRASTEIGPPAGQAEVAPDPADPAVSPGADDPRRIWLETLAVGVSHPVVPAPEKGGDDPTDAVRPVGESFPSEHRGKLDYADPVLSGAVPSGLQPDRGICAD